MGTIDRSGMFTAQSTAFIGNVTATNNSVTGIAKVIVIPQLSVLNQAEDGNPFSTDDESQYQTPPALSKGRSIDTSESRHAAMADAIPFFIIVIGLAVMMLNFRFRREML